MDSPSMTLMRCLAGELFGFIAESGRRSRPAGDAGVKRLVGEVKNGTASVSLSTGRGDT